VLVPERPSRRSWRPTSRASMVANWGHGDNPDGYDDLPLVCGGAIVDRDLPWDATQPLPRALPARRRLPLRSRLRRRRPLPAFKHLPLPFDIDLAIAQHPVAALQPAVAARPEARDHEPGARDPRRRKGWRRDDAGPVPAPTCNELDDSCFARASRRPMEDRPRRRHRATRAVIGLRHDVDNSIEACRRDGRVGSTTAATAPPTTSSTPPVLAGQRSAPARRSSDRSRLRPRDRLPHQRDHRGDRDRPRPARDHRLRRSEELRGYGHDRPRRRRARRRLPATDTASSTTRSSPSRHGPTTGQHHRQVGPAAPGSTPLPAQPPTGSTTTRTGCQRA
jgi:hypothetical protein